MAHLVKAITLIDGYNSWHNEENRLKVQRIVPGDNVTAAMTKAKMIDIEAITCPMFVQVGKKNIRADKDQLVLTGVPWTKNGIQLLHRQVTRYEAIQNWEYAKILDTLTDKYQVVGTIMVGQYGETLIVQLEMPAFYVQGLEDEKHQVYLTVTENRQTGKKHYGVSVTRVVCQNTYFAAVNGGLRSLPNGTGAKFILEFRTMLEQKMIETRDNELALMNHLFTKKVDDKVVSAVAAAMFPTPKRPQFLDLVDDTIAAGVDVSNKGELTQVVGDKTKQSTVNYDNALERQETRMKAFFSIVEQVKDENPAIANTAYAPFQAATYFWTHYNEFRSSEENAEYNRLFGDRYAAINAARDVLVK